MKSTLQQGDFRTEVLKHIRAENQPLPPQPFAMFVWPTELCSIGCAHCSYASKKKASAEKRYLSAYPEKVVEWALDAGVKKFVICGGGEPLDEPVFVAKTIKACSVAGLDVEIYTSGVSKSKPVSVSDTLADWRGAWGEPTRINQKFVVRLSVDAFHEELIGLEAIREWIIQIKANAPNWSVVIRAVRVKTDFTMIRLAAILGAKLDIKNKNSGWLILPDGSRVLIIWKGFVFEGRGMLKQLERLELTLNEEDFETVLPYLNNIKAKHEIGRPLSLHHAVSKSRIDIEIHADGIVHILQSQAPDLRLSLFEYSWESIRNKYYSDPLLHTTVWGGLSAIADLIALAKQSMIFRSDTIPFSIEKMEDLQVRSWLTAAAIMQNAGQFVYSDETIAMAREFLAANVFKNAN